MTNIAHHVFGKWVIDIIVEVGVSGDSTLAEARSVLPVIFN